MHVLGNGRNNKSVSTVLGTAVLEHVDNKSPCMLNNLDQWRSYRQSESCRPAFYSISGAIGTQNWHNQGDRVFKNMACTWLSLWVTEQHHILACLKQWSNNKTQLPNDQIKRAWCIATRDNVFKECILTLRLGTAEIISKTMYLKQACWRYLKRLGIAEKKIENKDGNWCILTVFETIWNCREKVKTLTRTFWDYLKRYLTLQWVHDLTSLKGVGAWGRPTFPWICENKDDKWCILPLFDTIFWPAETFLKAMKLNGAIQMTLFETYGQRLLDSARRIR